MARTTRTELAQSILNQLQTGGTAGVAKRVAAYLVAERKTSDLMPLMREVDRLRRKQQGIVEVTATSAYPLSDAIKKQVAQLLKEDKVLFNEKHDPNMVGGVRVETPEELLDLTVRNRLNKLKRAA